MDDHIDQGRVISDKSATELFPLKKFDGRFLAGHDVDLVCRVGSTGTTTIREIANEGEGGIIRNQFKL